MFEGGLLVFKDTLPLNSMEHPCIRLSPTSKLQRSTTDEYSDVFSHKYIDGRGGVWFQIDRDEKTVYISISKHLNLKDIVGTFADSLFEELSPRNIHIECNDEDTLHEFTTSSDLSRFFVLDLSYETKWAHKLVCFIFKKPKVPLYPSITLQFEGFGFQKGSSSVCVVEHSGHYAMLFNPPLQNNECNRGVFLKIVDIDTGTVFCDGLYFKEKYLRTLAQRPAKVRSTFFEGQYFTFVHHIKIEKTKIRRSYIDVWETMVEICMFSIFRQKVAARKIQKAWRKCIANPTYVVCRARLVREYTHLSSE